MADENNKKVEQTENIEMLIYEIDIRRQEIDAILENYEFELYEKGNEVLSKEEYDQLKTEYKSLNQKRKNIIRTKRKKSIWDEIPLWIAIYAVLQIIFSFYFIQAILSIYFADFLMNLFSSTSGTLFDILIYALPFLSIVTSLIILFCLKNKRQKTFFFFFFLIQLTETLITVGLMLF